MSIRLRDLCQICFLNQLQVKARHLIALNMIGHSYWDLTMAGELVKKTTTIMINLNTQTTFKCIIVITKMTIGCIVSTT